jgi:6-phosphogluconolactonase
MKRLSARSGLAAVAATVAAFAITAGSAAGGNGTVGALYTLTNSAAGNAVLVYDRGADGTISPAGSFATGGLGTGSGLGSQGAVVLSGNGKWLYAVNAGSNEISAFAVRKDRLALASKVASGGVTPISLTVAHDVLYVLNAGDGTSAGNISGYRIGSHGGLSALAGSGRPLERSVRRTGPDPVQPGRPRARRDGEGDELNRHLHRHEGWPCKRSQRAGLVRSNAFRLRLR